MNFFYYNIEINVFENNFHLLGYIQLICNKTYNSMLFVFYFIIWIKFFDFEYYLNNLNYYLNNKLLNKYDFS